MENELINQGLILMLGGMGTVFVFLTILVVVTTLMSRLVMKFEIGTTGTDITDDEIAAITAAIAAHRRK